MMTRIPSIALVVATSLALVSCDQDQSNEETAAMEQRIKELEQKTQEDLQRRKELEHELASQKLAMEWAAIERERKELEARRAELEANGDPGNELDALKIREEELAAREALAGGKQAKLVEEQFYPPGGSKLPKEAKFPLAGLEAGAFASPFNTPNATVDYQYFNDALEPYGTWYDTDEYGSVWQPAVCSQQDWRPYTRGRWVCSDRGWTWVSTEPFGWATYHYGRWALLENRGWIWVPGTEWAPNWCTWRCSDEYIGWAPLPPETLAYQNRAWDSRVERQYGIGPSCFCFVRARHFDHIISLYCVPANLVSTCLSTTANVTRIQITNGQIFCGGPGYHDLSNRLGRRLPFYQIHRHNHSYAHHNPAHLRSRVQGERLIVAAPTIQKTRPVSAHERLTGIRTKRTATLDPQAVSAYRKMRSREVNQPLARPTNPETIARKKPVTVRATPPSSIVSSKPVTQPLLVRTTNPRTTNPRTTTPRTTNPRATTPPDTAAIRAAEKQKAEAQLQAFRKMAREQRAIASAEKARREKIALAEKQQREEIAQQQRSEQAELQKIATQQAQRKETQRRSQEEAAQRQRDEEQRQRAQEQQRQREEMQRREQQEAQRQQEEQQRRMREEAQRRAQEEAQRRQREEQAQRQRADEQRRQREEAQRRQQQEQAQQRQREEAQRRSQEEAQRRQREEQQRQRRSR